MSMANYEYHVGCGLFGIYAGTLNKKGDMWLHKSNVTDEAFKAVAQYCVDHNEAMNFDYNGKRYRLEVNEIKEEEDTGGKVARKGTSGYGQDRCSD